MSAFMRTLEAKWHTEVPGTRWFRADLHLHTLDDQPGGISWKGADCSGNADPTDEQVRLSYARAFLKSAVEARIEVLGLTPHSAHIQGRHDISVAWDIVEQWQRSEDDDGVPFRKKIYAIFPGFEPSAADGKAGIHLLVLFDPEIGKQRYIEAFTVATGGQVWLNGQHQTSTKNAKAMLDELAELKRRDEGQWDYLCIAPHAFSEKGVIESLKGDMGKHFCHGAIAALELKDNDLPCDALEERYYLQGHLKKYCQTLIHGSDAYSIGNAINAEKVSVVGNREKRGIGYRYTFVKMASARIESLRQAFLSNDSRLRIAYERSEDKQIRYASESPVPVDLGRPWLRSVTISGGTSFFGGKDRTQVVHFSPDFTCVVGGRMTGKSRCWMGSAGTAVRSPRRH